MHEDRRDFLKTTLTASAAGVGAFVLAKPKHANAKQMHAASNGVVQGHSPKQEILYKKTRAWELFYKATY